ncbi:MAG: glutaredoxin family protein [Microcoleaceae cyanobacterium]
MDLILYSKPGCHLCEGLQEKLEQIQANPQTNCQIELEIRDITTSEPWFQAYQYEIPVLRRRRIDGTEETLPRMSPRASAVQIEKQLQKFFESDRA